MDLWDTEPRIPETYLFLAAFSSQRNAGQGGFNFTWSTQYPALSSLSLTLTACLLSPGKARNWMYVLATDVSARGDPHSSHQLGVENLQAETVEVPGQRGS